MIQVFEGDGEASEFEQQRLKRLQAEAEEVEYKKLMAQEQMRLSQMIEAIKHYNQAGEEFLVRTAMQEYKEHLEQLQQLAWERAGFR